MGKFEVLQEKHKTEPQSSGSLFSNPLEQPNYPQRKSIKIRIRKQSRPQTAAQTPRNNLNSEFSKKANKDQNNLNNEKESIASKNTQDSFFTGTREDNSKSNTQETENQENDQEQVRQEYYQGANYELFKQQVPLVKQRHILINSVSKVRDILQKNKVMQFQTLQTPFIENGGCSKNLIQRNQNNKENSNCGDSHRRSKSFEKNTLFILQSKQLENEQLQNHEKQQHKQPHFIIRPTPKNSDQKLRRNFASADQKSQQFKNEELQQIYQNSNSKIEENQQQQQHSQQLQDKEMVQNEKLQKQQIQQSKQNKKSFEETSLTLSKIISSINNSDNYSQIKTISDFSSYNHENIFKSNTSFPKKASLNIGSDIFNNQQQMFDFDRQNLLNISKDMMEIKDMIAKITETNKNILMFKPQTLKQC